jgi:hypothetical protein
LKKKLVAIAAAAVAMIPLTGSPAHASATGALAFECVAQLPEFPSPQATGSCGAVSVATGSVSGVTASGAPYSLTVDPTKALNNFTADFEYNEACVANEPPVLGTAAGTATVTGLTGVKGTNVPVTATATLDFSWRRVGLTAVITFTSATIEFSDDTATPLLPPTANAAAVFAPVLTLANTCPVGGPLQAAVAGTATFGV